MSIIAMKQLYKQNKMTQNKITLEDRFKLVDVETTLKMLIQHAELKPHHKDWALTSYKNIIDFKHQNDII